MKAAKIVSYIAHPIFVTTLLLAFLMFQPGTYVYYTITNSGKWFFLAVSFVLTVLAPGISVGYLVYTKQVSGFTLLERKERIMPMIITLAYTYGLYYLYQQFQLAPILLSITLTAVVGVAITLLFTFFFKISAHMISVAGATGMLLALNVLNQINSPLLIVLLFIASGIIGTARLVLNAHSLSQVLVGWGVGLAVSYWTMYFFTLNPLG